MAKNVTTITELLGLEWVDMIDLWNCFNGAKFNFETGDFVNQTKRSAKAEERLIARWDDTGRIENFEEKLGQLYNLLTRDTTTEEEES